MLTFGEGSGETIRDGEARGSSTGDYKVIFVVELVRGELTSLSRLSGDSTGPGGQRRHGEKGIQKHHVRDLSFFRSATYLGERPDGRLSFFSSGLGPPSV